MLPVPARLSSFCNKKDLEETDIRNAITRKLSTCVRSHKKSMEGSASSAAVSVSPATNAEQQLEDEISEDEEDDGE